MRKSLYTVAAIAAATALTLSACSGGGGETGSEDATDAGTSEGAGGGEDQDYTGETLTVWIMEGTNPDAEGYFDELKTAFKEQTGADLDIQMQPWAGAHDKFVTSIAGNTTPDVAEVGTTWVPEFAEVGSLAPLDDLVAGAGLADKMVEGLTEAGTLDGTLYGMPWYAGVRSFVYNTELFEAAGIEAPPTTWDELAEAVRALKAADSATVPFPIAGDSRWSAMPFIWGAGGDIMVEEDGAWVSALDTPETIAGLEYYTNLALTENSSIAAAETWKETDLLSAFERGDVGMIVTGNWTINRIKDEAPDMADKLGAFAIPGEDGGVAPSFLGGSVLSIFEGSDNKELAWEFIELTTTGDLATSWAEESGFFPGEAAALAAYAESDDPLVAPFAAQMLEGGRSLPSTPAVGQTEGAKLVERMLQNVLSGRMAATAAAQDAAAEMNRILGQG